MESKGLIFIPDISGYTRFVNQMEIEHCKLIIQELLETLINSNKMGLELSEIEGDAILFYRFGDTPDMKDLYKQVEEMFCEFHKQIIAYDRAKYCQCNACSSAIDLTLKIISHYGEFTGLNVKNYSKLIGKDIIIAHQLLKNDIEQHEYWLVTKNLQDTDPPNLTNWMKWDSSSKTTESGVIPYHFTQLGQLKNEIKPDPLPNPDISRRSLIFSLTEEYNTDIITLFHVTGDFKFRNRWQVGIEKVEEIAHYLPRIGMKSKFTFSNGEAMIYSSSYKYDPSRIEFTEINESNNFLTYYLLEKIDDNKTKFTIELYGAKSTPNSIFFNLMKKKKLESDMQTSLTNLAALLEEIKSTGEAV